MEGLHMAISFNNAFGLHEQGALLRERRTELLANNIANADTPGYKAQDLDFHTALANAQARQSGGLQQSDIRHFDISPSTRHEVLFRNVEQTDTGDGNSVDIHRERNAFSQNAMEYQTSLQFLNSKISGLKKALGGQ
jgi:flagellar basal-body rod protein FlgB